MKSKVTHVLEDSDMRGINASMTTLSELHLTGKSLSEKEYDSAIAALRAEIKRQVHLLTLEAYKLGVKEHGN